MRILANGREIPVKTVYGRVETINDMPRDVLEVYTDALMQAEDVEALVADTQWDLVDDHGNAFTKHGYNHVLDGAQGQSGPHAENAAGRAGFDCLNEGA